MSESTASCGNTRRTLDVGEEACDGAGREILSHEAIIRPALAVVQSREVWGEDRRLGECAGMSLERLAYTATYDLFVKLGYASSLLVVATATLALAACGADKSAEPRSTLESWRVAACDVLASYSEELAPRTTDGDVPSFDPGDELRRQVNATRGAVANLRGLPLPDENRADAVRFIEILALSADGLEEAAPRIEEASRRLDQVLASIDPEDLPPAPKEPTTVAGGIMAQLMSVPEYADAFADMMRAYESAATGVDDKEADRVSERLGVSECMKPERTKGLSEEALARCGSRGSPVALQELVDVARGHGITLDIQEETCGKAESEKAAGFDSDATNGGPGGLDLPDERLLREGHVFCDVADESFAATVQVTKYASDTETYIRAANVDCSIYPHSRAQEAAQVGRLKDAMEDVAELAAKRP